jgi:hypothetical protein
MAPNYFDSMNRLRSLNAIATTASDLRVGGAHPDSVPPGHGPLGVVTGVGVSEPTWRDVRSRDAHGWSALGNEE